MLYQQNQQQIHMQQKLLAVMKSLVEKKKENWTHIYYFLLMFLHRK